MKNNQFDPLVEDRLVAANQQQDGGREAGFNGSLSTEAYAFEEVEGYDFQSRVTQRNNQADALQRSLADPAQFEAFVEGLPDAWHLSFGDPAAARSLIGLPENIIGQDDRVQVATTTDYPWRTICSLVIEKNGLYYVGTGALVGPRTILTAGHNVFMYDSATNNPLGWADSITIIPGRNGNGTPPYGMCVVNAQALRSVKGWTQDKNSDYDWGAIILPSDFRYGDQVGYFGYTVLSDANLMTKFLNLSGYPADKGGSTQWYHGRFPHSLTEAHINYEIDTFGGHSGSPVWYKTDSGRYIVGIHTYGGPVTNSANRITDSLFQLIGSWKQQGA